MKVIYVAGPYTADNAEGIQANIRAAEEYGKLILGLGLVPIVPHAMTGRGEWEKAFTEWSHADWMERFCFPVLKRCDAIFMMPGWWESKGSKMEHDLARQLRMPVYEVIKELESLK